MRRVLSFRLGRVGGGAFLPAVLDHGWGCGLTTATLGDVLPENTAGISTGGSGSSISGGGGGKSESDGGEGNSSTESLPGPLGRGAFAGAQPGWSTPGRLTPERLSFPGLGGAAGGGAVSLLGDPEGSAGAANLLTRLSTEGLLGSGCSAQALDLMLEFRCGVGGGFFPPGLDVLTLFLPGEALLSGPGEAVGVAGGGGGAGAGGGGGGGNTRQLSGGGGGKSGEGAGMELGCHLGLAFTAGGDCGAALAEGAFGGGDSPGGGNWLASCFTTEGPGDSGEGGGFTQKLCCLGSVGGGTGPGGAAGEGGMCEAGTAGCFLAAGAGGGGVGVTACVTKGGTVLALVGGGTVTRGFGGAWGGGGVGAGGGGVGGTGGVPCWT